MPTIELDESGIFIETHVDQYVTVNLSMYMVEQRRQLAGKDKKPILILFEKMVGFDPTLRDRTEEILANISAMAFYVNPDAEGGKETKEVMESFYRVTPYPVPVNIFDDKQEAKEWLKQFI